MGSVVNQVKLFHRFNVYLEKIGVRLPQAEIVGLCKPRRHHESAGVATVRGVDLAEPTDLAGGDGAQRDLIG
jgi:hypothetical protein